MAEVLSNRTGRRKEAVCRVRLVEGTGKWDVNGRPFEDYFPSATHRMLIVEPLKITNAEGRYDVVATIHGGGISGQAGALRHALSRSLADMDPDLRTTLKTAGFLTRDPREKERRKYGLKKARKAPQYSKR